MDLGRGSSHSRTPLFVVEDVEQGPSQAQEPFLVSALPTPAPVPLFRQRPCTPQSRAAAVDPSPPGEVLGPVPSRGSSSDGGVHIFCAFLLWRHRGPASRVCGTCPHALASTGGRGVRGPNPQASAREAPRAGVTLRAGKPRQHPGRGSDGVVLRTPGRVRVYGLGEDRLGREWGS